MTEIVQRWLSNRLGILLDMDPDTFAVYVQDGRILAHLLYTYNIINNDQFSTIVATNDPSICLRNLKSLSVWMKGVNINCSDQLLNDITHCRGLSSIKLFYQVYLALHDKDKIHFIGQQKAHEKRRSKGNRFDVIHVNEPIDDPSAVPDHPCSLPLIVNHDVIQWHKDHYAKLMEKCKEVREKYTKYIEQKFDLVYSNKLKELQEKVRHEEQEKDLVVKESESSLDLTHLELLEMEEKAEELEAIQPDADIAKSIVTKIKDKRKQQRREKELKIRIHKMLLMQHWETLLMQQEKDFEQTISSKMLRQSLYEMQMASKIFEVCYQKQIMLENRQYIDKEIESKKQTEFMEQLILRNKSNDDQKYAYYFEKQRALELHQRLYAEKLRLKAERHYNMCNDALNAIVDISLRHIEYKNQYGEEVPQRLKNDWGALFVKQKPIFDILENVEELIDEELIDEADELQVNCYYEENERQNAMSRRDLENYCNCDWPWDIQELLPDYKEDDLRIIECGMNVLGHIVHRLLLSKYPRPPSPVRPNLPPVDIAACVNRITDLTILPIMEKLLSQKMVIIIQMEQAINYCLNAYKEETTMEYVDTVLMEETDATLQKKSKKKEKPKKGKKTKEAKPGKDKKGKDKKGKKGKNAEPEEPKEPPFADKINQTPRIYPCEEIALTTQADLGRMAYDLLNLGEELNDHILVAMFVEYLKSLKEIKGWLLLNYPTTFEQAALLEEALSGKPVPFISQNRLNNAVSILDYADVELREIGLNLTEKQNAILRKSSLLPNPDPPYDETYYETYLTAFINVKHESEMPPDPPNPHVVPIEEEEKNPLDEFYSDQGCNYTFYYKTFEYATIKYLAKMVIGDYTIPQKNSVELFGDTVLYLEENLNKTKASPGKEAKSKKKGEKKEKKPKPEKKSKETKDGEKDSKKSKDKKEKGDKKSKDKKGKDKKGKGKKDTAEVTIVREDKEVQVPEPEPEIEVIYVEPPPEPRAGEPEWRYSDLKIPEYFQTALATLWELTEETYICDFEEMFFIKRILLNAIVPYITYIKNYMREFIERPDNKQTHLFQFQTMYNEIDADLRDDEELKAEVHCRIGEFREKLWEICDQRMRESEQERQIIIRDNWVIIQISELTNNYVIALQLEIDRCLDTMQLVTDYYLGIITQMPSDEPIPQKIRLLKIQTAPSLEVSSLTVITEAFINVNNEIKNTIFHDNIEQNYKTALGFTEKILSRSLAIINKTDSFLKPGKGKGKAKGSPKAGKKGGLPKFTEPEPEVKEAAEKLIEEWNCSINSESLRVKLHLNLIKELARQDIDDILSYTRTTFTEIFNDILGRYQREIQSVSTACEVLSEALEAEVQLQPQLMFEGDKFFIQPNVLLFPNPLPIDDPPITERENDSVFTVAQIDILTTILLDIAPQGIMPERSLVFLLQDMIVQDAEDGKPPMVPLVWKKLKPMQVSKLSREFFGFVEYVDWKDFVIYNLLVSFPTENELMYFRAELREYDSDETETIQDYQFDAVRFWFEKHFDESSPQDMFRLQILRKQLFKLFQVNETTINYTALLLAFCKDENPIVGFAKALELCLGRCVCWDNEIGTKYVESVRYRRHLEELAEIQRQLDHLEAVSAAESAVSTLVDTTVHLCESVIIEDYVSEVVDEIIEVENTLEDTDTTTGYPDEQTERTSLEAIFTSAVGSQGSFIIEDKFSNIEIGYEATDNPPLAYILPFEVLLAVVTAALPWHSMVQNVEDKSFRERVEDIYTRLKNPEFNDAVLTHELLNDEEFNDLLLSNYKFVVRDPTVIVTNIIHESKEKTEED